MGKGKKKQIKIVDYRSVNLAWLIDFKSKVFSKELAPEIELVVAQETIGSNGGFKVNKGETLCIVDRTATTYIGTKPYGDVRHGEVARSSVQVKPREEWTTEDVAEYVVKRACLSDQCTYLELIEPVSAVSKSEYKGTFVSQARKCRFAGLVGALEYFYTLKKADFAKQFVWLDLFSANQPKLTALNVEPVVRRENERLLTEGLHVAIANFEQRVMFMDKWDGAAALTRAWCVWEIYGVAKAEKPLEIALPESEYDRFIVTLQEDYESIILKTSAVDVELAQCFNKADLETIHAAIRANSSFAALNDIIKTQLRLWVASTGKVQVEKAEKKANPDLEEISNLAYAAASTYQDQGDFANAELLIRKALTAAEEGADNPEEDVRVATCITRLASVLQDLGDFAQSEELSRKALEMKKKILGDDDPDVATSLGNLAELLRELGRLEEAEPLYRQALAIDRKVFGNEATEVATDLSNLGALLSQQGKLEEAGAVFEESLSIREKLLGHEHPETVISREWFAEMLQKKGDYTRAESVLREVVAARKRVLGTEHPHYASAMSSLAGVLQDQKKLGEAEQLFREALSIFMAIYGEEHLEVARELNHLADSLTPQGKTKEARVHHERALAILRKIHGSDHTSVADTLVSLGGLAKKQGNLKEAEASYREALSIDRKILGNVHRTVADDLIRLAAVLRDQSAYDQARPFYEESITIMRKVLGENHVEVATPLSRLAGMLRDQGNFQEAEALFRQVLSIDVEAFGMEHSTVAADLHDIALSLRQQDNKQAEAAGLGKEALQMAEKLLGVDHPKTQKYRREWG